MEKLQTKPKSPLKERNAEGQERRPKISIVIWLLNKKHQLLVGFRPDFKKWGLPGGHLEMCESFEECASLVLVLYDDVQKIGKAYLKGESH